MAPRSSTRVDFQVPKGTTVSRRRQILQVAAALFAEYGFHGVGVDDIGAAVGISGPALYHHFAGKDELLSEVLTEISIVLLAEAERRVAAAATSEEALSSLIDWHADFALRNPALITVQARDLASVREDDQQRIRGLQAAYVEIWMKIIADETGLNSTQTRALTHAVLGLLNSTPQAGSYRPDELRSLLKTAAQGAVKGAASVAIGIRDAREGHRTSTVTQARS